MQFKESKRTIVLNCKGKALILKKPIVMGIINVTPDSFFANNRKQKVNDAILLAEKMIGEGATILDIGGQSTKPGSEPITASEEMERVMPVIEAIAQKFADVIISVDTFYADVAKTSVKAGARIVNDISGGMFDEEMIPAVAQLNVTYVIMHTKGKPKTMQDNPSYQNIASEILDYFIERIDKCKQAGIKDVIIDPGFGFGKTIEHNYQLLKSLPTFQVLNKLLLVGVSRKGMIYNPLSITADEALNGTTVVNALALKQGADILRVHDVKEAIQAIELVGMNNRKV